MTPPLDLSPVKEFSRCWLRQAQKAAGRRVVCVAYGAAPWSELKNECDDFIGLA